MEKLTIKTNPRTISVEGGYGEDAVTLRLETAKEWHEEGLSREAAYDLAKGILAILGEE